MKLSTILIPLSLLYCVPAAAEIYKYVDENGRITYTNIPKKGSKKLDLDPVSAGKTRKSTGPADFPKVDNQTQKKRDDLRQQILRDELASEEKAYAEAQTALKDGETTRIGDEARNYPKYLARLKRLQENVSLHEKNIAALKKELGDLK